MKIFIFIFLVPVLMMLSLPEAGGIFGKLKCKKYGKRLARAERLNNGSQDKLDEAIDEIDIIIDEIGILQDQIENKSDQETIDPSTMADITQKAEDLIEKGEDLKVKVRGIELIYKTFISTYGSLISATKKFKRKCKKSNIKQKTIDSPGQARGPYRYSFMRS